MLVINKSCFSAQMLICNSTVLLVQVFEEQQNLFIGWFLVHCECHLEQVYVWVNRVFSVGLHYHYEDLVQELHELFRDASHHQLQKLYCSLDQPVLVCFCFLWLLKDLRNDWPHLRHQCFNYSRDILSLSFRDALDDCEKFIKLVSFLFFWLGFFKPLNRTFDYLW